MGAHYGEVLGLKEDNDKHFHTPDTIEVKASEYGALHVEQHNGRFIKSIAPPSEPSGNTEFIVSADYDPRIIYSDVIPADTSSISDKFSRVQLSYPKLDGTSGFDDVIVSIPNTTPRPCQGVKRIKVIAGRVTVYGGYTHPESD